MREKTVYALGFFDGVHLGHGALLHACRELADDPGDGWMVRIESPDATCCRRVESVHELQHALRLCGVEKEIIL